MRYILLCSALALMMAGVAAAQDRTGRDPFEATAEVKNPFCYTLAVRQLTLQGIVRTEKHRRAIVTIPDTPGPAVLKEGDNVTVPYRGISHWFTVTSIGTRNVGFQARSGATYEVRIQ